MKLQDLLLNQFKLKIIQDNGELGANRYISNNESALNVGNLAMIRLNDWEVQR
jgi:hypothetical protein